jgi:hypothetical protein
VRGCPSQLNDIQRVAVKKTVLALARAEMEKLKTDDFYSMPAVGAEEQASAELPMMQVNVESAMEGDASPNVKMSGAISFNLGAGDNMKCDADNFEAAASMPQAESSRASTSKKSNTNSHIVNKTDLIDGRLHQGLMNFSFYAPMSSSKVVTHNEGLANFFPISTETSMQMSELEMIPNMPADMNHPFHSPMNQISHAYSVFHTAMNHIPGLEMNMQRYSNHILHHARSASWHPGLSGMQNFAQHPSMNMDRVDETVLCGQGALGNNAPEFAQAFHPNDVEQVQSEFPTGKFMDGNGGMPSRHLSYDGLVRQNAVLYPNELRHPFSTIKEIDPRRESCPDISQITHFQPNDAELQAPITPMNQDQEQPMANFARASKDDCDHDTNQDQDLDECSALALLPKLSQEDEFVHFLKSVVPEEQAWKQEQEFESLPIRHRF